MDNFLYTKKTWNFIKEKNAEGLLIGYEELQDNIYRVFCCENNVKYFTILYPPSKKDIVGKSETNDIDYQDFVNNFKNLIDSNPPYFVVSVDFPTLLKTGNKLQIHESSRPDTKNKQYISCWSSTGDDVVNHVLWGGNSVNIVVDENDTEKYADMKFDPVFGDTWVREGYASWQNVAFGSMISVSVYAEKTNLQTSFGLNLILEGDLIKYSPSGPGTGTHGFASAPVLVPNYFSNGWWDYDDILGLQPNLSGSGKFDIYNVEKEIMRFINKVYINGTNYNYFRLESKDICKVVYPYFLRFKFTNVPGNSAKILFFASLFREIV